jgi:hypothetical protein
MGAPRCGRDLRRGSGTMSQLISRPGLPASSDGTTMCSCTPSLFVIGMLVVERIPLAGRREVERCLLARTAIANVSSTPRGIRLALGSPASCHEVL